MEYEEPAESLVTADTCVAATDVAVYKHHDNTFISFLVSSEKVHVYMGICMYPSIHTY